jgi:6-phosphofructokinase 1
MCAADRAVASDIDKAWRCGQAAVALAKEGKTGLMVTLNHDGSTGTAKLSDVAVKAKPMPNEFITADGFFVTDAFLNYLRPLVGEMPKYVRLTNVAYQ